MIYSVASESSRGLIQCHKNSRLIPLLNRRFSAETALEGVISAPSPVAGIRVNCLLRHRAVLLTIAVTHVFLFILPHGGLGTVSSIYNSMKHMLSEQLYMPEGKPLSIPLSRLSSWLVRALAAFS